MTSAEKPRRQWTPYTLADPCADCPFRSDTPFYLHPERADEIADNLRGNGADFHCHKTVDYSGADGRGQVVKKTRVCAGAQITMEKEGVSTQAMRIAERIGLYNAEKLNMDAPVYDSLEDWQRSFRPDQAEVEGEYEHCRVAAPGREDPSGYSVGGNVHSNAETPSNSRDHTCQYRGSVCCQACTWGTEEDQLRSGSTLLIHTCAYCADDER